MKENIKRVIEYHSSKYRLSDDSKADEIEERIRDERVSKINNAQEKFYQEWLYLGDFGDFKVSVSKTENGGHILVGRLTIKFKYSRFSKKLKIDAIEKHLKSLGTGTPGESYALQRVSYGGTKALLLLGSTILGGIQKDDNPGYIYVAEFQVTESGSLIILAYSDYAVKIISDFCEEAKLELHV